MLLFLHFLLIITLTSAQICPGLLPSYTQCTSKTIIILDASTYLPNNNAVTQEFDYVLTTILPRFAYSKNQQVALVSYGAGTVSTNPFKNTLSAVCDQSLALLSISSLLGRNEVSLLKTFETIQVEFGNVKSNVILFTWSRDQKDITSTGSYLKSHLNQMRVTVVTPNQGLFNAWNSQIYITDITNSNEIPNGLPYCISQQSCGVNICNVQITNPGTTNPTIQPPNTLFSEYQCKCEYDKIWNDIIFIFQTSASITNIGLLSAVNHMKNTLASMNVQLNTYSASNSFAQVGVISFGKTAKIVAALGSLDNNSSQFINISYTGNTDTATNLDSALQAAINQFSSRGRRTSKQIIHIYSSTYNPAGVPTISNIVNSFKEDGGIFVVYDYVDLNGSPDPTLKGITPSGYFIDSRSSTGYDNLDMYCDVNCFCGANEQFISGGVRSVPKSGCFTDLSGAASRYDLAMSTCSQLGDSGVVAMPFSAELATFINGFSMSTQMWNGLAWNDSQQQYLWADGTPLNATSSYSPWKTSPSVPPSLNCVLMARSTGKTMTWIPQSCTNSLSYICQTSPCDSTRYCDRLDGN